MAFYNLKITFIATDKVVAPMKTYVFLNKRGSAVP